MTSMHYAIRRIAGSFVLLSLALGWFVSSYWYIFTAFVRDVVRSADQTWIRNLFSYALVPDLVLWLPRRFGYIG